MTERRPVDPYLGFNFRVEIEGLEAGGFSEVSGLEMQIDVFTYREGGENLFEYQLPGPASYPSHLTLRRGLTDVDLFWEWIQRAAQGDIVRRNLTISLLGTASEPVMIWDCRRVFPVRWSGPQLRADSAAVAVESLELAHHGITRAKGFSLIHADVTEMSRVRRLL
ncbi:MAG: phage tail protein [Chloroflexales bacterium]|nr:phage tail protein [Chloroflexales bacterium]